MKFPQDKKLSSRQKKGKLILNSKALLLIILIAGVLTSTGITFAQELDPETILKNSAHRAEIYTRNPQSEDVHKFVYELRPGDTLNDEFWFVNRDNENNTLILYPVHLFLNEKNVKAASLKDDEKKEISKWITFEDQDKPITLGPEERKLMSFNISIPSDTPLGFYEGGFTMERKVAGPQGSAINNVFRKVYKIEITVTDNPKEFVVKNLNFEDETKEYMFANLLALKPEIYIVSGTVTTILILIISVLYFRGRKKIYKNN